MNEKSSDLLTGTVVRAGGGLYEVDVPGDAPTRSLACQLRGKLKIGKRTVAQPVVVGDQVTVRPLRSAGESARGQRLREGYIEEVLPRRSWLGRTRGTKTSHVTIANLDLVVVVMSVREPDLNTHRLDRFLVLVEANELPAAICFNKADLVTAGELKREVEPLLALYRSLGYDALLTSEETMAGIEDLRKKLRGHIAVFIGSSGVGKSSLANAVQPGLHLWVGDVMEIGKGRHTTTEVSLHPIDGGGYIADTPGVKTVTLFEQHEVNLPECFPEFRRFAGSCRFNDCTHVHEPGCAIRIAVEVREIAASRYESYLKMAVDKAAALKELYR